MRQLSTSALRFSALCTGLGLLATTGTQLPHAKAIGTPAAREVGLIVRGSSVAAVAAAVTAHGGRVGTRLPIIDGVAARVPQAEVAALAASAGVVSVSPDSRVRVTGSAVGGTTPPSVHRAEVRATTALAAGYSGVGVTVALLDTGIATGGDLAGRVVSVRDDVTGVTSSCVNLSGEPTCADDYGHGTFLAGLIAGSGVASGGRYKGVAPQAKLVSIKVGAPDGSADVSNVLAGIQWAVSFKDRYSIRILNLSLSTDSTSSWRSDPFNYAVERAWAAGITVVVAASNRGPDPGTISKPGDDPWVITVGAVDDKGTAAIGDDRVPDYTARGPAPDGVAKPDVVAPGSRLVSLRSVGSTIDREFPTYVSGSYHQGSGTSMATAVVSGVLAQALSAHPTLQPDQLKYALMESSRPVAAGDPASIGRGLVDAYAVSASPPAGRANVGLARSSVDPTATSLDSSRGTVRVDAQDVLPVVVQGTLTAQLLAWEVGQTLLLPNWNTVTWTTGPWVSPFRHTTWAGSSWTGHNWEGCSWSGGHETTCTYGAPTSGSVWYGAWG